MGLLPASRVIGGLGLFLAIVSLDASCRRSSSNVADLTVYEDQGRVWAHGPVQVLAPFTELKVLVKRQKSGQTTDTFALFAKDGDQIRDLGYVDYHPEADQLLSFVYRVEFRTQDGASGDIYAVLEKGGRSFGGRQYVHLGQAIFAKDSLEAPLKPNVGLKIAAIAQGAFAGLWSLYYPDVEAVSTKIWDLACPKMLGPAPIGSEPFPFPTPGGGVAGAWNCRPVPPEADLCQGDPTTDGCRPPLPDVPEASDGGLTHSAFNLEKLDTSGRIYALARVSTTGRLEFRSRQRRAADTRDNAQACADFFLAVARSVGDRRNDACLLTPSIAEPQDGFVTCGVLVSFERAQTYLERTCNVIALFQGDPAEMSIVQVLKR